MEKKKFLEQVRTVASNSPYYRLLGMEVTEINEREPRIQMPFKEQLMHPYGIETRKQLSLGALMTPIQIDC